MRFGFLLTLLALISSSHIPADQAIESLDFEATAFIKSFNENVAKARLVTVFSPT